MVVLNDTYGQASVFLQAVLSAYLMLQTDLSDVFRGVASIIIMILLIMQQDLSDVYRMGVLHL
jgi:hypothetical protein